MSITRFGIAIIAVIGLAAGLPVLAQQSETEQPPAKRVFEGTMTLEKMGSIIMRLDKEAALPRPGTWQFKIEATKVIIVTDAKAGRMRILVPVARLEEIDGDALLRILQANFDTALDSRYAIAQKILWAVFIHPLHELHERQFIEAIGQTVNLALTYGTTYNSGALSFGGGDSNAIIRRQLIDRLLKKGQEI